MTQSCNCQRAFRAIYQTAIIYAISALGWQLSAQISPAHIDAWLGRSAPGFSMPDLSGRIVSLSDYRGKHVLIDFWSADITACLNDLPDLKAIQRQFGNEIVIVSITSDDSAGRVREVAEREGIRWTQIVASQADQDFIEQYAVEQIPAYFLIDPEGRLAHSGKGLPEAIRRESPSVRRGWFRWLVDQAWGSDFGYS